MRKPIYPYRKCHEHLYEFVSVGKAHIIKQVEFVKTEMDDVVNIGFGDLLDTGELDDASNSNNGDLAIVIATIIHIIEQYSLAHPDTTICFQGSTLQRTKLYGRILQRYHAEFSSKFQISATPFGLLQQVAFDPITPFIYQLYFIKIIT